MLFQYFSLTGAHSPLRRMSRASSLECDSLLARMNMTTWSCVCSEMSRPFMSTTKSPSRSLGSHRPAYKGRHFMPQHMQSALINLKKGVTKVNSSWS